jgi:amphi-Trp domain-containing protein
MVTMLRSASKLLTTPLRFAPFRPCAVRFFSESASSQNDDVDVTVSRGNKQAIALLRRVALAMESGKSWRTSVDKKALVVPKTAEFSVELETEGNENCLELQFKWTSSPSKKAI